MKKKEMEIQDQRTLRIQLEQESESLDQNLDQNKNRLAAIQDEKLVLEERTKKN